MTTDRIPLDELEQIALNAGQRVTYDFVRGIAYLRLGQVRYVANLEPVSA
jgi:hypothetical protein